MASPMDIDNLSFEELKLAKAAERYARILTHATDDIFVTRVTTRNERTTVYLSNNSSVSFRDDYIPDTEPMDVPVIPFELEPAQSTTGDGTGIESERRDGALPHVEAEVQVLSPEPGPSGVQPERQMGQRGKEEQSKTAVKANPIKRKTTSYATRAAATKATTKRKEPVGKAGTQKGESGMKSESTKKKVEKREVAPLNETEADQFADLKTFFSLELQKMTQEMERLRQQNKQMQDRLDKAEASSSRQAHPDSVLQRERVDQPIRENGQENVVCEEPVQPRVNTYYVSTAFDVILNKSHNNDTAHEIPQKEPEIRESPQYDAIPPNNQSNTDSPNTLLVTVLEKMADRLENKNNDETSHSTRDSSNLIERDHTKLEYFLTTKRNYKMWHSIFMTEIGLKRLDDIIDENVIPYKPFSSTEIIARKRIVKGIILGHIDENYQEQVIDFDEPVEMLRKLEKLKRDEINDTTVSIKDQFRLLTFKFGNESVHDFNLKFDELVRRYDTVSPTKMTEPDKRDAYYQIMAKVIPSIKEATYRDIAKGQGEGYNFEELRRYVQRFEAENKPLLQNRNRAGAMMAGPDAMKRDRCYNCGVMGHISTQCHRKPGDTMCYVCLKFGHRSFQCPLNHPQQGNANRLVKRSFYPTLPATKRFCGFHPPNNMRRGNNRGTMYRGGLKRGGVNRRGGFGQRGGGQLQPSYTNKYNTPGRGTSMRGRGGRGRGYGRGTNRPQNNPSPIQRPDNSRTGVSSRNAAAPVQSESKPSISQVNAVLPSLLDVSPFGLKEQNIIQSILKDKERSYEGEELDDNFMLLTPYQMDDEVIVKHVVYRYGQWWLNRTAYENDLSNRERDAAKRESSTEKRSDPILKQDEKRDYENPQSELRHLKGYPTRRDEDDEPGAGSCAMMARGGRSRSRSHYRGKQSESSQLNLCISFIGDSGACDHIIKNKCVLNDFIPLAKTIRSANRNATANLKIEGEGEVYVRSNTEQKRPFILTKVKYSPDISENLLSFRRFTELGYVVELNSTDMKIYEPCSREILLLGTYSSPSWIITLDLIQPHHFAQELENFNNTMLSVDPDTHILTREEESQTITNPSQSLETGGVSAKIAPSSNESIESPIDSSHQDENKHETTSVGENKLATEQNEKNDKSFEIRKVNPRTDSTTAGLDLPIIQGELLTDLSQVIDVENPVTTLDETKIHSLRTKLSPGFLWHVKLGHASVSYLKELQKRDEKLKDVVFEEDVTECDVCAMTKIVKLPFTETRMRAIRPLQTIHADLMGPITPQTFPGKHRFIAVFIDDFSRLAMAYAMTHKSETGYYLERFLISTRNMLGTNEKVCYLQSDQGTEFTGGYTKQLLEKEQIELKLAPPNTPQHNGVAERFNRTLLTKMRALLLDSGFPHKFWDITLRATVFTYNRTPHKSINFECPLRKFAPHIPCHTEQLKRFGCLAYMLIPKTKNNLKFASRALKTIFVGYLASGYLVYHPQSHSFFETKHVRFREQIVYKHIFPTQQIETLELEVVPQEREVTPPPMNITINKDQENNQRKETEMKRTLSVENEHKNKRLKQNNGIPIQTRSKTKIKDISFVNYKPDTLPLNNIIFYPAEEDALIIQTPESLELKQDLLIKMSQDPLTYEEAMSRPDNALWKEAVKEELHSMAKNQVWHYIDRPPKGVTVIDSRWLFKKKRINEKVIGKGRLVIRGFKDRNVYELSDTNAPVSRQSTAKIFLAIVNKLNLEMIQLDVKTAFLHSKIEEDIYMEIPLGVDCSSEFKKRKVCKLNKSLYGLKTSPQRWNRHFTETVKRLNLIPSDDDPCLFKWKENNNIALLLLYVDDMLIASNQQNKLIEIKTLLQKEFEMTDLGTPQKFLGLELERDRTQQTLKISQTSYMHKMLEKFNMTDCKQHLTPMVTKGNIPKLAKNEPQDACAPYREAIGTLLYLSGGTRPDLSYTINTLSRKQSNPSVEDWTAVKRAFRYVRGTTTLGLTYTGKGDMLELYTDSSFADCDDSHSTSGYIIRLFNDTIAWRSHKQTFVAMSTCEAEFISLSEGCMEVVALHKIIHFILDIDFTPIAVYCDNQAAVNCVTMSYPLKLRHCLEKNYNYVREAEKSKRVKVRWIPTTIQLADIMTKALPVKPHTTLRDSILNKSEE